MARAATDDGAAQLGEVALVDRDSRIGRLPTVYFQTLLDENAASHIALGSGLDWAVGDEHTDRVNRSEIHIDFMIGSDDDLDPAEVIATIHRMRTGAA